MAKGLDRRFTARMGPKKSVGQSASTDRVSGTRDRTNERIDGATGRHTTVETGYPGHEERKRGWVNDGTEILHRHRRLFAFSSWPASGGVLRFNTIE